MNPSRLQADFPVILSVTAADYHATLSWLPAGCFVIPSMIPAGRFAILSGIRADSHSPPFAKTAVPRSHPSGPQGSFRSHFFSLLVVLPATP